MASSIRVMLVDDHILLRHAVAMFLQEENISVIGEASSGEQLLQQIDQLSQPDAVLIDIDLPGISGIETTRKLHQMQPSLPIICMSVRDEASVITAVFQAGACGFVCKGSTIRELALMIYTAYAQQCTSLSAPSESLLFDRQAQVKLGDPMETKMMAGGNPW